jgi:hypothetical protein
MLFDVLPLLLQQRIDDDLNKTILHVICLNIHNVSDSFYIIRFFLEKYPEFAKLPLPTENNDLPLHWLCCSNPKPSVLKLLLDAYPQAAATANDHGILPIHTFVSCCRCPESLRLLLDAAPNCMHHADARGLFPLHSAVGRLSHKGKIPEEYLVPLLRACTGMIVMDYCHSKSKESRLYCLGKLRDWALSGSQGCNYVLVNEIHTLDIGGCELGSPLVAVLCDLLPHCCSMTVLDISANSLSREDLECLLPVTLQMPKLQRLVLDDNVCEAEDAAIILSMLSAPHLDASIRCKSDEGSAEDLENIAWQLEENSCDDCYEYDDDENDSQSDEESIDGSQDGSATDDSDDENGAASGDGDSNSSGWMTDDGEIADADQGSADETASHPGPDAVIHNLLERLFVSDSSFVGRCEGAYDSDQGEVDISQVCGDEDAENDSNSDTGDRTELRIDRDRLIGSSLDALQLLTAKDASRDLEVEFRGERGIDGGGLTKTFLTKVYILVTWSIFV